MKFTQTEYANSKEILKNDHYVAIPTPVLAAGGVDEDGKKVVKAGAILDKTGKIVNDGTAVGVLLHDVDVTYGNANGTLVIHGNIDGTKLPNKNVAAAAVSAMPQIKFFDINA